MKKLLLGVLVVSSLCAFQSCGDSSNQKNVEIDYNLREKMMEPVKDVVVPLEVDSAYEKYKDNSLTTGQRPYGKAKISGYDSKITVRTSPDSELDVVVILKQGDNIVKNAYICAGDSYSFDLPNGTYQTFFYSGKGWNPEKDMGNGNIGGFVSGESFQKDSPLPIEYQELIYELILQPNGNFQTKESDQDEMFK